MRELDDFLRDWVWKFSVCLGACPEATVVFFFWGGDYFHSSRGDFISTVPKFLLGSRE